MYGFTVDRVVMPSEFAAVKQEEQGPADLDTAEGTSLEQEPQPRLHEYTLKNGTKVYGFTVDRVVMPSEWAAVKQEEQGLADLDTPARPFASPPFIRSWTDVLRAARAGCRMRPRSVRVRSIRLAARRRGVERAARSETVVMPKFRPRKRRRRRRRRRGRRCVPRIDATPASCARHFYPRRQPVRRLLTRIRPVRLAQDARKKAEEKEAKAKAKAEKDKAKAEAKAVR